MHAARRQWLVALVRRRQWTFFHEIAHPSRDAKREYILAAFERNDGNRTLTARPFEVGHVTRFRNRGVRTGAWRLLLRGRSSGASSNSRRASDGCGRQPRVDARRLSPVAIVVAN